MTTLHLSIMTNILLNQNTNFRVDSGVFLSFFKNFLKTYHQKSILPEPSLFCSRVRSAATKNLDELSPASDQTATYIDTTVTARG